MLLCVEGGWAPRFGAEGSAEARIQDLREQLGERNPD